MLLDAAFAALRYHPTPSMILSSSKRVLLANNAMGRLLNVDQCESGSSESEEDDPDEPREGKILLGWSLSQMGIAMSQEEEQNWGTWDRFLDSMAVEHDQSFDIEEAGTTSRSSKQQRTHAIIPVPARLARPRLRRAEKRSSRIATNKSRNRAPVRDVRLEVFISYDSCGASNEYTAVGIESMASKDPNTRAEMTVLTWTSESQRYFTVTLVLPVGQVASDLCQPYTVSAWPRTGDQKLPHYVQLPPPNIPRECSYCGHEISSPTATPSENASPALSVSLLQLSDQAVDRSEFALKKLVRMKNAMLDATDIPIIAMWGDGSLATYNKAVTRLLAPGDDPVSEDASDVLSRIQVYTEDFGRALEIFEYPIVKVCRERKGVPGTRFGIIDAEKRRRVFECVGSAIFNEKTGDFQAGVSAWKEVTWYLNMINAQSEQILRSSESQVWTANPDGQPEYFSPRWYQFKIHELVEARLEAKRLREQLLNVITHAQLTVWAIDRHYVITLLEGNLMWEDEPAEFMQECLGKNIFHAFGKHQKKTDWDLFHGLIEQIMDGKIDGWTSEHQLVEGKGRWYRTRLAPIRSHRRSEYGDVASIQGVIGCSIDVTDAKSTNEALHRQETENIRLSSAETAAKDASKIKSQFLANMSHEIRTPIAGVIGMAELLVDTDMNDEQRGYAESIQRSANSLLTVINDILDLSKVESGRLDIEEIPFSLSLVVQDVCKMLSFAAERKSFDFLSDVQIGMKPDLVVMGDPGRVRQILTNLLTNSIKFTSQGHVKLTVSKRAETNTEIEIDFAIEDTGIGISEEVQARLFKPFSQADASTARKYGGTGLGLTICKNLVDLMRGEIELVSKLGFGTTTTFCLPFHKTQLKLSRSPPSSFRPDLKTLQQGLFDLAPTSGLENIGDSTKPAKPHPLQKTTITLGQETSPGDPFLEEGSEGLDIDRGGVHVLVVEDNAINQTIAVKIIRKLGFSANAVYNGQEALDYLLEPPSATHPKADIILMDCQMPVLDGYRATHILRHHRPYVSLPGIRSLPIVAMTASAIQGDKEKCQRAGMDDYLAKPVKGPVLEKMLLKWAVEGKRKSRLAKNFATIGPLHTEQDSICGDPSSEAKGSACNSSHSEHDGKRTRDQSVSGDHPSDASDDDRLEAAERAIIARDGKLIEASIPLADRRRIVVPSLRSSLPTYAASLRAGRSNLPTPALTEANMGRFDCESEVNPFDLLISHDSDSEGGSKSSSGDGNRVAINMQDNGLQATPTQATVDLDATQMTLKRDSLARKPSSLSQVTIEQLS